MRTAEIRKRWLDYFAAQGHEVVPSASLVSPDPSLLFTVAGMVPFIPYLTGQQTPPWPRATSVQKCIRTSDIEEVGKTTRHGTFFQMNGNFSFGDYFKEGAVTYAWDLVTGSEDDGKYGFDPDSVWVTVFHDDDEAAALWKEIAGLPEERIQRRGMADNYWSTGQPGPAGPCSEIYIDRGPEYGQPGGPVVDESRFMEIWNLVFMQYERGAGGGKDDFPILGELKNKNIDTGMGLERVALLKQGVENMYEIDEVVEVIHAAEAMSGKKYGANTDDDVRMRVIADHVRSGLMLMGDGVTPGNEGRGYVLRRLLRRSVRSMRLLGVEDVALPHLLPVSMNVMKASYPELETNFERISQIAYGEEDAFRRTLTSGTTILDTAVAKTKADGGKLLDAEDAFALHDTYGFPIDLTLEMASEQGISVDEDGFRALMLEQKERARADAKSKKGGHADIKVYQGLQAAGVTEFTGYRELQTASQVRALIVDGKTVERAQQGDTVEVVLPQTPFYAESGGQEADAGIIRTAGATLDVMDVQRPVKGVIVHTVKVTEGEIAVGDDVSAQVDPEWRLGARQAHSGTHLVHAALREVLGPEALQSGSYNKPGYLRLDFSWPQALSAEARSEVEDVTNRAIRGDMPVSWKYMTLPEAKQWGAIALFGETYDEEVRVVEIGGPWSRELCGGTHVDHSSQVGMVALTSEGSVGSGSRRLEAFVGIEAFHHLAAERALVSALTSTLKVQPGEVVPRIEKLLERVADAEKKLAAFRTEAVLRSAGALVDAATDVGGVRVIAHVADIAESTDDIKTLATDLRERLGDSSPVVVAIATAIDGRPQVCVATNQTARDAGLKAGDLVKVASAVLGGGGGGKPDLAQGGGQDASKIADALSAVTEAIRTRG
ncbi:MAG: alanine--tRNA ligase [Actinobacteria bacterium HGW-Actinobacteria-4]|nr:MAG: alanine--tRNA ligase [Actinobacteria bacterium HGW-Actinobacteria-4]